MKNLISLIKDRKLPWRKVFCELFTPYRETNRSSLDCQLVAISNCAAFYGKRVSEKEYQRLIDLSGGRYGACTSIDRCLTYFGLKAEEICPNVYTISWWIDRGYPIFLAVDDDEGYHAIALIAHKKERFRVLNLRSSPNGWISKEKLKKIICAKENILPTRNSFWVIKDRNSEY